MVDLVDVLEYPLFVYISHFLLGLDGLDLGCQLLILNIDLLHLSQQLHVLLFYLLVLDHDLVHELVLLLVFCLRLIQHLTHLVHPVELLTVHLLDAIDDLLHYLPLRVLFSDVSLQLLDVHLEQLVLGVDIVHSIERGPLSDLR